MFFHANVNSTKDTLKGIMWVGKALMQIPIGLS